MAENIDELQIEIESDATSALNGLENLARSLENLKKAVGSSKDTAAGLKALVPALRSLSKIESLNLTANVNQIKALNSAIKSMNSSDYTSFGDKVNAISSGITQLTTMPAGDISVISRGFKNIVSAYGGLGNLNLDFAPQLNAVSGAISSLSTTSERLNAVDFSVFGKNVEQLSKSLQPMQGFKTQASSLLTALRVFPETAAALNGFTDFGQFSAQVQTLAGSLTPLSTVNSKLGATIDAMTRVTQVSNSLGSINFGTFSSQVASLAGALTPLQDVNSKLGATLNNLSRVGTVAQELSATMKTTTLSGDINKLASSLSGLNAIGKSNLGSVVSQLKQIPNITKSLDPTTVAQFGSAVEQLVVALEPLAKQMESVAYGFSLLPKRMQSAIAAANKTSYSFKSASGSFKLFGNSITRAITKVTVLTFAFRRVWTAMAGAFKESNTYIENLNLFTVTMGDATDEAMKFAEAVQDAMGIDIAQWIENQGMFMRMATGFGIASDQAELMSKNLTQLAYDMSSFFNADVETAMQKLQSGMSGQIKGLKAWGYNLSVAALQETALSLGIEQSVRTMTEAQKAQLRYITLIQKSYGVMGDMGRTLVTPANALRILGSQLTQMKRAFGDIISVIAVKFIPYVQALVSVLTDAANRLAALLGFELPKIDYSGLELGSDVIDGIGDDLEDTTDKAKELKKQLMGFDELNILKSNDSDDDGNKGASYDLGIELPEYDFLAGVESKTDEFKEKLKDILDFVLPIAGGIAAWSISSKLLKNADKIAKLFSSTETSIKGIASLKKPLGIALSVTGAIIEWDGAFDIGYSGLNWENGIKTALGAALGIGGSLLAFGTGPAGWVVGIGLALTVGITASVVGAKQAMEDIQTQIIEEVVFDGQGIGIDEVSTNVIASIGNVQAQYDMSDTINTIQANREAVGAFITDYENLFNGIQTGVRDAVETLPQLTAAFKSMYENTTETLNAQHDLIVHSLSGATGEALRQAGLDVLAITDAFNRVQGNMIADMDAYNAEYDRIVSELESGAITVTEATRQLEEAKEMYSAVLDATGVSGSTFASEFQGAVYGTFRNVDLGSVSDVVQAFEDVGAAASEAISDIDEYYDEQNKAVQVRLNYAIETGDTDAVAKFRDAMTANNAARDAAIEEVNSYYQDMIDEVFVNLMSDVPAIAEKAAADYDNLSWFQKMFTTKEDFVQDALEKYRNDTIIPIADGIRESLGEELSKDMDFWGEGAMSKLIDSAFGVEVITTTYKDGSEFYELSQTMSDDFGQAVDAVLPERLKASGISAVDGLVSGIADNLYAFENIGESAANSFGSGWNSGISAFNFNTPSIGGRSTGYARVGLYADGGYPKTGSMFIANEAGPELVGRIGSKTAVANNDQILQGIASAVYEAMMAAHEDGGSGNNNGGTARIVVQIGDRAVGEAAVEFINGQIRQTGTNPINY